MHTINKLSACILTGTLILEDKKNVAALPRRKECC